MITLLNTSILTQHGPYDYRPIPLDDARAIVRAQPFQSAIGHQATADILTELLGVPVPLNRTQYEQAEGDLALVFKLNGRPPEGTILSREQIDEMGYSFGVLYRLPEMDFMVALNAGHVCGAKAAVYPLISKENSE